MLRAFTYIDNHPIANLHNLYKEIITTLCDSEDDVAFGDLNFSAACTALLDSERSMKNDYLTSHIENLYEKIKTNSPLKAKIKTAFVSNNKIQELCGGDGEPYYYGDLEDIGDLLHTLTVNLYQHIFNRGIIKSTYKTSLENYFNALTHDKKISQCPFCGLSPLTSKFEDGRDAFDHYFPKGKYPFSSVNILNLFPMCYHCNSLNKRTQEVIYVNNIRSTDDRKKAFYPFDLNIDIRKLEIKILIKNKNLSLADIDIENDIDLYLTYTDHEEEKEQWDRVFGITKRYKGRIQAEISDWLKLLLSDYITYRDVLSSKDIIERFIVKLKRDPLIDKQFLKAAFFQALNDEGILERTIQY